MRALRPDGAVGARDRQDRAWLPISGAARALGVSTSTLRAWAADGRVPHVRTAGGHRRFNPEALAEWLAERPDPGIPREERSTALAPAPDLAAVLVARADRVADLADDDLGATGALAFQRLPGHERRRTAVDWVMVVAEALRTGRLGEGLEQARAHGHAHGAAGSPAEDALAGAIAMGRAIDTALGEPPEQVTAAERDHAAAVVRRLTVRIADAWADATREGRAEAGFRARATAR